MSREQRIPIVNDSEASQAQLDLLEPLRRADGTVLNIFRTLANHPDLARRWLVFGNHVLAKSTLSPRVRELVILRTGWRCNSEYEWGQHVLIAQGLGIDDDEIARLMLDEVGDGWVESEACAIRATDELHAAQEISSDTWNTLSRHYDREQMMDLVFAVGQYTLVSMALNSFGVQRDSGVAGFES
ncbi:MAG: carboxymuconolactone decarboxylase family protein [Acidimicrobiales bacterium]